MTLFPLPSSLRLRFLLAITLWVVVGIGAIWLSATEVFRAHVEASYHEELEVHVRELGRLTQVDEQGQLVLSRPLSDPRYEVPLSGFYWQVTADGKATLHSASMTRGSLDEEIAHSSRILYATETGPTGPAITYGFVRPGPDGEDIHFVIATDQSELDRLVHSFMRDLTLWLVGLGALLLVTGIAIINFGLHPLDRLSAAIARLRSGEASELEGRYPAEIAPLAKDLNEYIHQNADMITKARVQAGNLAHSLRTPLAVVTDEAERLAEQPESRGAAKVLLDQCRNMGQHIEYQLARARSSAGQAPPGQITRLPDAVLPILRAMERLHRDKNFTLDMGPCDGMVLPVDAVDFAELLSILLDNAGKWARHIVVLSFTRTLTTQITITIRDDGPGLSDENLEKAFEIGSRFDTGTPGSGLGLAIARDIAETIGAELRLVNKKPGLAAILTLG